MNLNLLKPNRTMTDEERLVWVENDELLCQVQKFLGLPASEFVKQNRPQLDRYINQSLNF